MTQIITYLNSPHLVERFQKFCGAEWVNDAQPCQLAEQAPSSPSSGTTPLSSSDTDENSSTSLRERVATSDGIHEHSHKPHGEDESTQLQQTLSPKPAYTIKYKILDALFHFGASLGNEIFYITFFPFWIWNVDSYVGRRVCIFWALFMYVGQATKDLIKLPRPKSPPVIRMEDKYALEYGMPSTHAMVGAGLPFSLLYFTVQRYIYPFELGLAGCLLWTTTVCFSRIYLGMHSVLDVLAGLLYVFALMPLCFPWLDTLDYFILHSDYSPAVTVFVPLLMCICYPRLDRWSTARGDTTVILAVTSGCSLAFYLAFQHGHLQYTSSPPPYPIITPDFIWLVKLILRLLVGIPILVISRAIMKSATLGVLSVLLQLDHEDPSHKQQLCVELPHKFLTYTAVAFNAVYTAPIIFRYLGIERETFYTEI